MKYFIKTYGCQNNEWEAARIDFMLQRIGLTPTTMKDADIIFITACSVRQTAVDRILGQLHNLPDKTIIITGCILPQDKIKFTDRNAHLWDTGNPEVLKSILISCRPSQSPDVTQNLPPSFTAENIKNLLRLGSATSSYLPIMSGCNNFCSYCAVPYTKGREVSRPFDDIVADFKALLGKNKLDIILLGQNVNSYAFDFTKLLRTLNDIPGDFQITFTSNHPKDMSDDVIDSIKTCAKVKKQIHLPLQSGSDEILKAMNRPYTKKQYLNLIEKLKTIIPDIQITTDVIVGFPGESEEDFQATVELFKKVNFTSAYVNKYSPRQGTAAYELGDPISWQEKQRRWSILNDIAYWKK